MIRSAVLAVCCCLAGGLMIRAGALADPVVGVNLERLNYYSDESVFLDMMKHSQPLFAQQDGAGWMVSTPGAVTFGPDGYPTAIASDHAVQGLIDFPKGYADEAQVLLWDGTGQVRPLYASSGQIVSSAPGRVVFNLPSTASGSVRRGVYIDSTDPSDPVHNIRVVPLAQESAFAGGEPSNPFRQPFLDRWSPMGTFRYKDWAQIDDNNNQVHWSDRAMPTDPTQGVGRVGVALEYQIAHANVTHTDPWFNVPHQADDDYVRNMAMLIRDRLDTGLVTRIEYSNEVWNGVYTQADYARAQGAALPGSGSAFEKQMRWYSQRSVEVFDIFADVFTEGGTNAAGMERLVRVMGGWAGADNISELVLTHNSAYQKVDALAIAPYFGYAIGSLTPSRPGAQQWKDATWEQRITWVEEALQRSFTMMDNHRAMLSDNGLDDVRLLAYEGGQHFVGSPELYNDSEFTSLMEALQHRPEMRDFYFRYLEHWFSEDVAGEDFLLYASTGQTNQYGSWGHYEYEGQPLSELPKMQGVLDYLNSVPEPSAAVWLGFMIAGLVLRRRRG